MTDHSRQDKTRSPAPNRLAQLYHSRDAIAEDILDLKEKLADLLRLQRKNDLAIKRACGDQETI